MSLRVGLAVTMSACSFSPPAFIPDAAIDTPGETIYEELPQGRVTLNLIGLWTFDDPDGSTAVADTAPSGDPVALTVFDDAIHTPPTFAGGRATVASRGLLFSADGTHLAQDCKDANAVTLEAWVAPRAAFQGTLLQPTFIAGLADSVTQRDVVLLQSAGLWSARVRTSATEPDGDPALYSTSIAVAAGWTHLAVVADNDERIFYVNGEREAMSAPGPGTIGATWNAAFAMHIFEEPQRTRGWTGSISLVALYNRALTTEEIQQNTQAGPDAP
ncbi:MAG: LamG domain-containing protein [Kofleriaceae bacterium]